MTKMLHLNWNDYPSSLSNSAKDMINDKEFMDVTLVFDDDEQICSSKFMLSICSPFFRRILKRNSHIHPLIYLKGIRSTNMRKIINFIFHGEIFVTEEELESFLENAKDLEVKGLSAATHINKSSTGAEYRNEKRTSTRIETIKSEPQISEEEALAVESLETDVDENTSLNKQIKLEQVSYCDEGGDVFSNDSTNENQNELMDNDDGNIVIDNNPAELVLDNFYKQYDEETSKLFNQGNVLTRNGACKCKFCGKELSNKDTLKKHMEIHMNNSYECNLCWKTFGTKNSFNVHMSRRHKNSPRKQ